MDSQPAIPLWSPASARSGLPALGDALLLLVASLFPLAALLMLARRVAGALIAPTSAPLFVAAVPIACLIAVAIHLAIRSRPFPLNVSRSFDAATDVSLAAIALSLSIPG